MTNEEDIEKSIKETIESELTSTQQAAEDILTSIITVLDNASVIAFSKKKKEGQFSANDEQADKAWELFVKDNLTANPKLKDNETFHNYLQRHRWIFLEINSFTNIKIAERVSKLLQSLKEKKWDKLFHTVLKYYSGAPKKARESLISMLNDLENAAVIVFPNAKEKLDEEKADEVWRLFIEANLTEECEREKDETYYDYLQRHRSVFFEINRLINIKLLERQKVPKLLRQLKNKNWEKLFCTVQNRYVSKAQQEAENILSSVVDRIVQRKAKDIVSSILITLENTSVMAFSDEEKPKFSAKGKTADKAWEKFVKANITANPKLKNNETFYNFLYRRRLVFLEINNLKNMKLPDGKRVFSLLYLLLEKKWDKLFYTVLNCYLNSKVFYEEQVESFDINYQSKRYQGRTLVHAAVKQNSVEILQELIKRGADLEISAWTFNEDAEAAVDSGGLTPLHYAANGSYSCMKILIQEGVDVNVITKDRQESALHLAAGGGFIKCVKLLVDSGAKLDRKDFDQKIPYQLALEKGHKHCAQYLAVAMRRQEISLPSRKSSKEEELTAVELLPMGTSLTAPIKDTSIDVPIHHAVSNEDLALIISLLDTSAIKKLRRVNHFFSTITKESYIWGKYIKENLTADSQLLRGEIFYNFLKRHEEVLSAYHKSTQTTLSDSDVFILLCNIARVGWEKLFTVVLKTYPKFDVNFYRDSSSCDQYLIHYVVSQKTTVMLAALLERGASLKKYAAGYMISGEAGKWVEECGNSPLQQAVESGAYLCVVMLLGKQSKSDPKSDVEINKLTADDANQSALHIAAKKGDLASVKLLVDHGALLDQKNGKGNIPYQVAQLHEHEECANYLAKKMQEKNLPIPRGSNCVLQ